MILRDGMWSGQSALIVGGGPSLRGWEKRLECVADSFKCIAINRAFEFVNYPDLWLSCDAAYWKAAPTALHGQARRDDVPRVWVDHGEKPPGNVEHVIPCAAPPGTPNRHWSLAWGRSLADGVGVGGNSGFAALNLAEVLGAETIYLLGFDLRGEAGRTANFHDGYTHTKPASDQVYDRFLDGFRWAATQVRARVVVLETYPGASRLDCWEKKAVEEVL